MFNPDSGEPFGLPKGTVRGGIAIAFAATLIQQVLTGAIDPITFLAVAGPFLGFYAGTRPQEPSAPVVVRPEPPLLPPALNVVNTDN